MGRSNQSHTLHVIVTVKIVFLFTTKSIWQKYIKFENNNIVFKALLITILKLFNKT